MLLGKVLLIRIGIVRIISIDQFVNRQQVRHMTDACQLIIQALFFHSQRPVIADMIIVKVGHQRIVNRPAILQRRREMSNITHNPFSRTQ